MHQNATIEPATPELAAQEHLLPFLLNPHSYPHHPRTVRLVQTHASFVFIAPPYVYKIKKPVNFGFLNFSTLEKRLHFCEREVVLNSRLCPKVYLGVVPISARDGRFVLGGGRQIVEYAVWMRKLSDPCFLDQLVARQEVVPGDLNRITRVLKRFYEAQHPTKEIESWGRIGRLRVSTDENFRQTREFIGRTLSRPAFEAIRFFTDRFYSVHARLFASRIKERWIRDCHGDLHLEHIHLTPRTLHIYDCIEFNDRFRYVDVASDAAFLAMDLDFKGRPDLARHFATQMASALRDRGMPHLLDFYKCYRAYVRGKVESLHSIAHTTPEEGRQAAADRARRYFRLALEYAVAGSQPLVLVVMGRIASGKSTLAHALGAELGWDVYSSDCIRKRTAGYPLYERSSAAARRRLYSAAATEKTYRQLISAAEAQVRMNHSVILDATFSRRAHRALLEEHFANKGIACRFIEAQASDATVKQRLRMRGTKREEQSDARLEDFDLLTRLYELPVELPKEDRIPVRTNRSLQATLTAALSALAQTQVQTYERSTR